MNSELWKKKSKEKVKKILETNEDISITLSKLIGHSQANAKWKFHCKQCLHQKTGKTPG